jgi:hypothetical protein
MLSLVAKGKADSAGTRSKRGKGKGAVRCIAWLDLLGPISPTENEHDNGKSTVNDRYVMTSAEAGRVTLELRKHAGPAIQARVPQNADR